MKRIWVIERSDSDNKTEIVTVHGKPVVFADERKALDEILMYGKLNTSTFTSFRAVPYVREEPKP